MSRLFNPLYRFKILDKLVIHDNVPSRTKNPFTIPDRMVLQPVILTGDIKTDIRNSVDCPKCCQVSGDKCRLPSGRVYRKNHAERISDFGKIKVKKTKIKELIRNN